MMEFYVHLYDLQVKSRQSKLKSREREVERRERKASESWENNHGGTENTKNHGDIFLKLEAGSWEHKTLKP